MVEKRTNWHHTFTQTSYTCPNPTLLKIAYVILFLKVLTFAIAVGSVSVGEQVLAVGKVTPES